MIFTSSVCQGFKALHASETETTNMLYSTNWTGTKYETFKTDVLPDTDRTARRAVFPEWREQTLKDIKLELEHSVWNTEFQKIKTKTNYFRIF